MGSAIFYHLTRSSAEETLRLLLTRAQGMGWRVMIRHPLRDELARLDLRLWQGEEEDFLPHGLDGGPHDVDQPILLGQGAAVNGAGGLFLLGGALPLPGDEALERIWILFDGASEAELAGARRLWTELTGRGMAAQYWAETEGRWQKRAEKAAGAVGDSA